MSADKLDKDKFKTQLEIALKAGKPVFIYAKSKEKKSIYIYLAVRMSRNSVVLMNTDENQRDKVRVLNFDALIKSMNCQKMRRELKNYGGIVEKLTPEGTIAPKKSTSFF